MPEGGEVGEVMRFLGGVCDVEDPAREIESLRGGGVGGGGVR